MAFATNNLGPRVIYSFDDVKADMPANGVGTSALSGCSICIDGTTAGSVDILVSYDLPSVIATGDALWTKIQTEVITSGMGAKVDMWVAPVAVKLATTTAAIAARILT